MFNLPSLKIRKRLKLVKLAWDISDKRTWAAAIEADCQRDPARMIEVRGIRRRLEYLEFQQLKLRLELGLLRTKPTSRNQHGGSAL